MCKVRLINKTGNIQLMNNKHTHIKALQIFVIKYDHSLPTKFFKLNHKILMKYTALTFFLLPLWATTQFWNSERTKRLVQFVIIQLIKSFFIWKKANEKKLIYYMLLVYLFMHFVILVASRIKIWIFFFLHLLFELTYSLIIKILWRETVKPGWWRVRFWRMVGLINLLLLLIS